MKKILLIIALITIVACNFGNKKNDNNDYEEDTFTNTEAKKSSNTKVVSKFLNNVRSLKKINSDNPINVFKRQAESQASKVFTVSKGNINSLLSEAKNYKHLVITTADHTIVKVINLDDCIQSGSWQACMPFGKGFIKKGDLEFQRDYINNIIGTPDSQVRKAYFFN